jgi:hypothetical protein
MSSKREQDLPISIRFPKQYRREIQQLANVDGDGTTSGWIRRQIIQLVHARRMQSVETPGRAVNE